MIFCVEDDNGIREIELYTLRSTGFEAQGFGDASAFFEALKSAKPKLIILDVMLPGEDGVTVLRKLKSSHETEGIPVIMATAKGEEYDKVKSLDLGADDYLVKPFGMMEMVSRIRAVLRRSAPKEKAVLTIGNITLDTDKHLASISGKSLSLTLKEYELLKTLMEHPGSVFDRDKLLSLVWGVDFGGETRTVDMHITTLRQKISEATAAIATVRGVGYRIEEKIND
ncbi:MAG: response regulator transcription factor [Clostridiales bacterium]|nr:response regulator transcription factor [Clostridiales bacterium]